VLRVVMGKTAHMSSFDRISPLVSISRLEKLLNLSKTIKQFETGQWLGRWQAFALIAKVGLTWQEFCQQRAGMSRASADRTIDRLEEFGEAYFQLSQVMHISPERYRTVESAVADQTIEFHGEKIPITRENSVRIAAAVGALQRANEDARSELLRLGTPLESKAPVAECARILSLHNRMNL
jgi:hypothetical protein